jgi:hypothetical protein
LTCATRHKSELLLLLLLLEALPSLLLLCVPVELSAGAAEFVGTPMRR